MKTQSYPYNIKLRGSGDLEAADVLMIGEAPGYEEIRSRRVFAGRTGDELRMYLQKVGISKRVNLYFDNVFDRMLTGEERKNMSLDFIQAESNRIQKDSPE